MLRHTPSLDCEEDGKTKKRKVDLGYYHSQRSVYTMFRRILNEYSLVKIACGLFILGLARELLLGLMERNEGQSPHCTGSIFDRISCSREDYNKERRRLGVIIPFPVKHDDKVRNAISKWETACEKPCRGSSCLADLILYVSCCEDTCGPISTLDYVNSDEFAQRSCFGRTQMMYACLSAKEEGFPHGVNNMFYKALYRDDANPTQDLSKDYDNIFWMEHDVTPLRSYWLDALQRHANMHEPYMVKGSVYVGDAKDKEVSVKSGMLWLNHINGNALYNLKSECLQKVIERAQNDREKAFDVEIQQYLYAWASRPALGTYKLFQHCIHEYKYSQFIFNCVGGSCVHPFTEQTYLVHGNEFSTAGNYT